MRGGRGEVEAEDEQGNYMMKRQPQELWIEIRGNNL
jgi:hypothetical protein